MLKKKKKTRGEKYIAYDTPKYVEIVRNIHIVVLVTLYPGFKFIIISTRYFLFFFY